MKLETFTLSLRTRGHTDIIDVTGRVQECLIKSGMQNGQATVFVIGSTAGITTVEFEPGLVENDLPAFFEQIAPYNRPYAHHETWGDDNGGAHLRASLLGSSLIVPFAGKRLMLGTWQQIVLIDFDTRARMREFVVQVMGK